MRLQSIYFTGEFVNKKIFHGFDVIRTFLAFSVALGHFFYWNGVNTNFPRSFFVAVDFFFVLSGFVLTQSILISKPKSIDLFIKEFTSKRIKRLFPLYIFVFLVTLATFALSDKLRDDPFFYYFISFFLLQSLGFDSGAKSIFSDTSIGIAWSLSIEFWIGILFFPIVFLLKNKPVTLLYLSVISLITTITITFNFTPSIDVNFQRLSGPISFAALRGWIGFSCGSAVFVIYYLLKDTIKNTLIISITEFISITFLISALYLHHDQRNEFIAPVLFSMVLLSLSFEKGLISKILTHKTLSTFRYTSYSIYLIHPLIIFIWRWFDINFTASSAVIYIILVYILSIFSFRLIERPAMKFKIIS